MRCRAVLLGSILLATGLLVVVSGCETTELGPVKPRVNSGNDPNQAKSLRSVKVGEGETELDLTKGPQKIDLPEVDTFGELPVDAVRGEAGAKSASRPTTQEAAAAETKPVVQTTVISRLSFGARVMRGTNRLGDAMVDPAWARTGTALLPGVKLVPGEEKVTQLGDGRDGCEVRYAIGEIDKEERTPVRVTISMWGPQHAEMRWTSMVSVTEGKTFNFVTREGTQVQFNLGIDGVPKSENVGPQGQREKYRFSVREALGK